MTDTPDTNSPSSSSQSSDSQSHDAASQQPERSRKNGNPRKRRRRGLRVLIAFCILVLLILVAVQAVLWSTIPKSLVLSALQKTLGVKVEADSVSTGWWGGTQVENVTMTIPLEEEPFIKTGSVRVKHRSLIELVIFGLELKSVDIDSPAVYLRQSPSGRWNVVDLVQSFAASNARRGGEGAAPAGRAERPNIPAIKIHNAIVHVTDNQNRTSKVGPLVLSGTPSKTAPELVWEYQLNLPDQLTVDGRVAVGGDWRNEAKINVQDIRPLLSPFVANPPDVNLAARWEGSAAAGVQGRLAIERLAVQGMASKGAMGISSANGEVTVTPENLELLDDQQNALATVVGGQVLYNSGRVKVDDLILRGPGVDIVANADVATATQTGELSMNWRASALPAAVNHAGTLTARLDRTFDGRVEATAAIDTNGHLTENKARNWAGRIELSAAGSSLTELSATVQTTAFRMVGPRQTVDLNGLVASLKLSKTHPAHPGGDSNSTSAGMGIALQSLRLRDTDLFSAEGQYRFDTKRWWMSFAAKELPIPKLAPDALGVSLRMAGDSRIIHLQSARLATSDTIIHAVGSYVFIEPEPLSVKMTINHAPPVTDIESRQLGGEPTDPPLLAGRLAARGDVTGTVHPLKLEVAGEVQGVDVRLLDRDLGHVSINVKGYVDTYRAQLWRDSEGPPLSVLGAQWELEAIHDIEQEATTLTIGFADLPLKEVGDLIKEPTLSGTANGSWAVYVPTYIDVKNQVRAGGKLEVRDIVAKGYELDSLEAWTVVENGRAGFEPLLVRSGGGVFTAKPSVALDNLKSIEIADLRLVKWPLALPPSTYLTVDASAPRVAITLGPPGAAKPAPVADGTTKEPLAPGLRFESGPISASAQVQVGDVDAGTIRLNGVLDGRSVEVTLLSATLFDSRLEAKGRANLDDPNAMTASYVLNDVNSSQLRKLVPGLEAISGSFDLRGGLSPVSGPDALAPMAADVFLISRDVIYRPPTGDSETESPGIRVGDGRFQVQLQLDPKFQLERAVLSDQSGITAASRECPPRRTGPLAVNTLEAAGGILSFWGRLARHEDDRQQPGLTTLSSHFRVGFRCLDVNQILQAYKPDNRPTPGLTDGSLVLYGSTRMVREPVKRADANPEVELELDDPITPSATAPIAGRATAKTVAPSDPEPQGETFLTSLLLAMQGDGQLRIYDSDLGNIEAIAFLYNAMRLGQGAGEATGKGELAFRVENGDVFLNSFRYFNRGVDVRAFGTIYHLPKLQKAPIRATAHGSVRALAGVEIPIVRSVVPDLDAIISALQQGGTSIEIRGTLGEAKMRVVMFEDLGQSIRELLIGEYKQDRRRAP